MAFSLEEKVRNFAICSRFGVIVLQCLANIICPDHDAGVFLKPLDPKVKNTPIDTLIEFALGGLTRWDGQYFLHVAHYGYTYENTLAFFPLFPLITRQLGYLLLFVTDSVLSWWIPVENIISLHTALILVSVLVNNILFVLTAKILFRLGCSVLKNEKLAFVSAILFCVNPASIFFSAAYSESLYSFLTFYGLLHIEKKNSPLNYILIGMTAAVRSNGLINLGFIAYKYLKAKFTSKVPFLYNLFFIFGVILSAFPFVLYQFYCYIKFCTERPSALPDFIYDYGVSKDFVFPGNSSVWCRKFTPLAYAHVQKHYWNVGFLNYYEAKQIPNFVLAAPMVVLVIRGSFEFVRHYKFLLLYMGFFDEKPAKALPLATFPYVLHGIALTVFAVLVIHVQVTTRLLASSSPLPYWFAGQALCSSIEDPIESNVLRRLSRTEKHSQYYYESTEQKKSRWKTFLWTQSFSGYAFFIKWYFLGYFFVGTFLFANFLPWT